jgi:hypothetical protein
MNAANASRAAPVPRAVSGQRDIRVPQRVASGTRTEPTMPRSAPRRVRARAPARGCGAAHRDEAVGEDGFDEARDIVRDDELAAVESGPHLRRANELERRAGARAEAQVGVLACRAGERDGVLLDGGGDVHAPRQAMRPRTPAASSTG